jgi:hypothetical protein
MRSCSYLIKPILLQNALQSNSQPGCPHQSPSLLTRIKARSKYVVVAQSIFHLPAKDASFFDEKSIPISVGRGDNVKTLHVHKKLLTLRSEYFARRFNGPWTQAQEGPATLLDEDPAIFELYLHVLYSGRLPLNEPVDLYEDASVSAPTATPMTGVIHPSVQPPTTYTVATASRTRKSRQVFRKSLTPQSSSICSAPGTSTPPPKTPSYPLSLKG